MPNTGKNTESQDWNKRKLCNDGNCIGIIGSNGRCKECGKPYVDSFDDTDKSSLDEDDLFLDDEGLEDENNTDTNTDEDDDMDWDNRILCSDENCIGVIGPDGNCKECGKPSP